MSLPNVSYITEENKTYYKQLNYQTIEYQTWSGGIITPNDGAFLDANGNKLAIVKNIEIKSNDSHNIPAIMTINGKLFEISKNAFSNIDNFWSINLPSSVQVIGEYAFANCKTINEVFISKFITKIPAYCFQNCIGMQVPILSFDENGNSSIIEIGEYAYDGCNALYNIEIPETITKIGKCAFRCQNNENDPLLYINDRNTPLTIGEQAFSNYSKSLNIECRAMIPPAFEENTFENSNITIISVLPELVETYKSADGWSDYADIIEAIEEDT